MIVSAQSFDSGVPVYLARYFPSPQLMATNCLLPGALWGENPAVEGDSAATVAVPESAARIRV